MRRLTKILKLLASILPVVLLLGAGVGIYVYLVLTPTELMPDDTQGKPRLVRVFEARRGPHRMTVTAYGTSRASEEWAAIAEVSGRATEVNERFDLGEILPAGTWLVKIDQTDYKLAEKRLEAEIRAQQSQLDELERKKANLESVRAIQVRQVELATAEFERLQQLLRDDAASESARDIAESAKLTSEAVLQETDNRLALIPVQRDLLTASLDVLKVQLEQSRRELDKCTMELPLAARCASRSVEQMQFVAVGERLGTFLAMEKAEVVTMMETRKMQALFPRGIPELGTLDLTTIEPDKSVFDRILVPAEVRWGPWQKPHLWHGRVVRFGSSLDVSTRSFPVIVEVLDPYKNVKPGVRPPLIPDVFCHVTLFGATVEDVVVIPRDSLRELTSNSRLSAPVGGSAGDESYCVHLLRDDKLHVAPVSVLALEEGNAVIGDGIDGGEMVILTDLFPASEGMSLEGQLDESVNRRLGAGRSAVGQPDADEPAAAGDSRPEPAAEAPR